MSKAERDPVFIQSVSACLKHYYTQYEKKHGSKYFVTGFAKERLLMNKIRGTVAEFHVFGMIDYFLFTESDDFVKRAGYTIGVLHSRVNHYLDQNIHKIYGKKYEWQGVRDPQSASSGTPEPAEGVKKKSNFREYTEHRQHFVRAGDVIDSLKKRGYSMTEKQAEKPGDKKQREGIIITARTKKEAGKIADEMYGEDAEVKLIKKGKTFSKYQSYFTDDDEKPEAGK